MTNHCRKFDIVIGEDSKENMLLFDEEVFIEGLFFSERKEVAPKNEQTDAALSRIKKLQGLYHPVYGADNTSHARFNMMNERCDIVRHLFSATAQLKQIRILDIGTNLGYVPLKLSELFPHSVGLDVDQSYITFDSHLGDTNKSSARFYKEDIFAKLKESKNIDLYNVDCLTLFNVIHQIIFVYGLQFTKQALGLISREVDFMLVELAERSEYSSHPSAFEIPLNPDEMFSECGFSSIERLPVKFPYKNRALYLLRRNKMVVGNLEINFSRAGYSANDSEKLARKYYFGKDVVVKEFRAIRDLEESRFLAEIAALERLAGLPAFPQLIAHEKNNVCGRVVITKFDGVLLSDLIQLKIPREPAKQLFIQVCEIVCDLFERGIYQNDFSSHNMIVDRDGVLHLFDFDRSGIEPVMEPFGSLAWVLNDLLLGLNESYKCEISKKLEGEFANDRKRKILPGGTAFKNDPLFAKVYELIRSASDYQALIKSLRSALKSENRSFSRLIKFLAITRKQLSAVDREVGAVAPVPNELTKAWDMKPVDSDVISNPSNLVENARNSHPTEQVIRTICEAVLDRHPAKETIDWLASASSPQDVLRKLISIPEAHIVLLGMLERPELNEPKKNLFSEKTEFLLQFDEKLVSRLRKRAKTFRLIFEKLLDKKKTGHFIVETGALRIKDNWEGDGQSTHLFGEFCRMHQGTMFSVDTSLVSVETARSIVPSCVNLVFADSVTFLGNLAKAGLSKPIDLLYLDSYDVDFENPLPSAEHHLRELDAAKPLLGSGTVIAVDDTFLKDGKMAGKGLLLADSLKAMGATLLDVEYQAVWEL